MGYDFERLKTACSQFCAWNYGRFLFNPKFRKFRLVHQVERTIAECGPALKVVHFVVPSTALLYPAFKNNNQTRGGLGRVCATGMYRSIWHVEFPKFQSGIFVDWKAPFLSLVALKGRREKDKVEIRKRRWSISISVWSASINSLLGDLMQASVEVREFSNLCL